jgi:hypothetical protein
MIKRVNFTGRRRIPRDRVDIEVYDGQPRRFHATINLDGFQFLPHAAVVLEATCAGSSAIERFEFGEVENIHAPSDRRLIEIQGQNVFFSLKVIDRSKRFGRLLGVADHIRPQRAGKQTVAGRRGILPLEPAELGQEVWRLEFRDHDVFLLVNKDIPGLVDRAFSDPLFYSAVYPIVVRHILARAIAEDVDIEEDNDNWPVLWQRFAKNLHPAHEDPPKAEDSEEDRNEWIDEVAEAFCETHLLKDKYQAAAQTGYGGES